MADMYVDRNTFEKTVNPTVDDDETLGCQVGHYWVNTATKTMFVCTDATDGAAEWDEIGGNNREFQIFADAFDLPNPDGTDWKINVPAEPWPSSNSAALPEVRFDDTVEEGVGFDAEIPAGRTSMIIGLRSRPETGAASNLDVIPKIYCREQPDAAAEEAWTTGTALTKITMGTSNEFYRYNEQTIALSTLGLVSGRMVQFEITRDAPNASDTLVGFWNLRLLKVRFI